MGILYIRKVQGPAEIAAWDICEETGELLKGLELSPSEKELFATFRTDSRQRQWLAYRRLIKELISPESYPVHYDEMGKPFLAGSNWHISVTHTGNFAGVILSSRVRVGIDMEMVRTRIERVKEKYLSEEELASIPRENRLEFLTLGWCAKEALYKLFGHRSIDFRENLHLSFPAQLDDHCFKGAVVLHGERTEYTLFHERRNDLFIVWVAETGQDDFRE